MFFQVVLSEDLTNTHKPKRTASLSGPIFLNKFAKTTMGQSEYTGLTEEGATQYETYLNAVIEARKDPDKRQFEKDHLEYQKTLMDIECEDWHADEKRKSRGDPKEGIATDNLKDLEFNEADLFSSESEDDSDSD